MPYIVIILVFLADRLAKRWAAAFLIENGPTQVHPWLTITETYNRGIAFGLFQGIGPLVGWLTIAVVVGMFIYMMRTPRQLWLIRLGMALIVGGAMGNLVDRVIAGEVLDFIQTPLRWGIFNVADIGVNVGMIVMVIGSFIHKEPEPVTSDQLSVISEETEEQVTEY